MGERRMHALRSATQKPEPELRDLPWPAGTTCLRDVLQQWEERNGAVMQARDIIGAIEAVNTARAPAARPSAQRRQMQRAQVRALAPLVRSRIRRA